MIEIPIDPINEALRGSLSGVFAGTRAGIAEENIQARIRGTILMALSNKFGWLVLATGNKSETSVGYCTLYGDTAGGFAVIKDVPKTWVYELARHRNRMVGMDLIPRSILDREPTAELKPRQRDEDTLPPYELMDRILELYVGKNKDVSAVLAERLPERVVLDVVRMVERNEYKRRQAPPGIKITPLAFGKDRRMPITNRFVHRRSRRGPPK